MVVILTVRTAEALKTMVHSEVDEHAAVVALLPSSLSRLIAQAAAIELTEEAIALLRTEGLLLTLDSIVLWHHLMALLTEGSLFALSSCTSRFYLYHSNAATFHGTVLSTVSLAVEGRYLFPANGASDHASSFMSGSHSGLCSYLRGLVAALPITKSAAPALV